MILSKHVCVCVRAYRQHFISVVMSCVVLYQFQRRNCHVMCWQMMIGVFVCTGELCKCCEWTCCCCCHGNACVTCIVVRLASHVICAVGWQLSNTCYVGL